MNKFLDCQISEKQLFEQTPLKGPYDAIYLCSAMVLKEYRNKGIAIKLTLDAIENIRKEHPIKALFVWAFSKEGDSLAEKISLKTGLPLKKKVN
ncbi:MAG TPA: GNAT family N-acetyltransferase, partial [Bacteroidia bacterium]|nr:GNAT family N-acetyltransferase [Bacteroidia bacterium]